MDDVLNNKTLLGRIEYWSRQTSKNAFLNLPSKGESSISYSYLELYSRVSKVAGYLSERYNPGDRLLLLASNNEQFLISFLGAILAGLVPVPCNCPRAGAKQWSRLSLVIKDAQVSGIIGENDYLNKMFIWVDEQELSESRIEKLPIEEILKHNKPIEKPWLDLEPHADELAFIQYTSGSTGDPKGVMVTHKNLVSNLELIFESYQLNFESVLVSWLPLFHDMGLISVLSLLYTGGSNVLMLPVTFIRDPLLWLEVATKYNATFLGGPNFSYELLLEHINSERLKSIDLSTVKTMFNGAEPISATVIEEFIEKFQVTGLKQSSYRPCYGMAEVTLLSTISESGARFVERNGKGEIRVLEKAKLGAHVACGPVDKWLRCRIVNPESLMLCEEGAEGEIWLSGDSVSKGYWAKESINEEIFTVQPANESGYKYLRTGDVGFIHEGLLYVTNRIKDMIIIRGRNYYPQDIERTVSNVHPALSFSSIAAFSVMKENTEVLSLVCEVSKKHLSSLDISELYKIIRKEVVETFEVFVENITFIRPRTLSKTSSGKKQRSLSKQLFLDGQLSVISQDTGNGNTAKAPLTINPSLEPLKRIISKVLKCDINSLTEGGSLIEMGGDSLKAALLANEIESNFKAEITPYELIVSDDLSTIWQMIEARKGKASAQTLISPEGEDCYAPFSLTDMQEAYYVGSKDVFNLGGHSLHTYMEIDGDLDIGRFMNSWNQLVAMHPMLRAILTDDGQQKVLESVPTLNGQQEDFRHLDEHQKELKLVKLRDEMSHQSMDLTQWPFFDIRFSKIDESTTRLHLSIDGIFLDFRSFQLLFNQLIGLYRGTALPMLKPSMDFIDYIYYLKHQKNTPSYDESLSYWKERIGSFPAPPKLPLTDQRLEVSGHKVTRQQLHLNNIQLNNLEIYCKHFSLTRASVMLAVFAEAVGRWSESTTFTLNVPIFNRPTSQDNFNTVLGNFSSFVLIAVDHSEKSSFAERAKALQVQMHGAINNSQVSGIEVVRQLTREKGHTFENGFPVVFTHLPSGIEDWDKNTLADIKLGLGNINYSITQTPQVWLDNQVWYTGEGMTINWDSIDGLFPEHMSEDMFVVYENVLLSLVESEENWSLENPLYELPSRQIAGNHCQNVDESLIAAPNALELILKHAKNNPDDLAVVFDNKTLSYYELIEAALKLAANLVELGVETKHESRIAVAIDKSDMQVVAVLGVMLAGAAYVPIDMAMPSNRKKYILSNSECEIVVTLTQHQDDLYSKVGCKTLFIDELIASSRTPLLEPIFPNTDHLAMVIYTSGTSGKPKAVMVEYGNLNHMVACSNKLWKIDKNDACIAITNLFHDLATYDIFGLLSVGGKIVMPTVEQRRDPSQWHEIMQKHEVTLFNSVPTVFEMYLNYLSGVQQKPSNTLKNVILGGDWISVDLIRKLQDKSTDITLTCIGGPTETTVFNIYHQIVQAADTLEKVPYGKPFPNNHYQILDNFDNECPLYVVGEMVCSGSQVTRGYLNNEEASSKAYFQREGDNTKYYRTGDMGYRTPDGNVFIVGRKDNQVKLSGYRIELDEIEFLIDREIANIERCVAKVVGEANERKLALFYMPNTTTKQYTKSNSSEKQLGTGQRLFENISVNIIEMPSNDIVVKEVRDKLSSYLPNYMVPVKYYEIDNMPLTVSGKIDRSKLYDVPNLSIVPEQSVIEEISETQDKLLSLWQAELNNTDITIDDNFFEVGGNSLKLINLHAKMTSELKVDIQLTEMFGLFCIRALADYIDENAASS